MAVKNMAIVVLFEYVNHEILYHTMHFKLPLFIFTIFTFIGCSNKFTAQPNQSIYFIKDKDGIYLYNPETKNEKIVFKANEKQEFLDEPLVKSGDTLTFGVKGEKVRVETSSTESGGERYFNNYYSVDLKTGKSWLSGKVKYEVIGHSTLNIKSLSFDSDGNKTVLSDTSMRYNRSTSSSKGVVYNESQPRFFSKHSLGEKSVFSERGDIYYEDKSGTSLLVDYKGTFDPKFGSGYIQPQLDPTGQYVIFRYLPGVNSLIGKESLQKIDIASKNIEVLKTGEYNNPTFSADGKFILFKRNEKHAKTNTWISSIYLLELSSLNELKIGNAYDAQWAK